MREFSDPKCFLRLAEMQDLPISNEIAFSSKCFLSIGFAECQIE